MMFCCQWFSKKKKHCHCKPGSVPAPRVCRRCLPFIYCARHHAPLAFYPPSRSVITASPRAGNPDMSMVYMNLQPPGGTARRSPAGWWSLTHAFSPLPLRAVIFFFPNQPSPTASTFRSGAPCAARTFLPPYPFGTSRRQTVAVLSVGKGTKNFLNNVMFTAKKIVQNVISHSALKLLLNATVQGGNQNLWF